MRCLWWDGLFAESSEVIWLQFFTLYALALGAGTPLIGVLAAAGSVFAALSMLPGAILAEKTKRYKLIVLLTAGGCGRLVFLLLAAIPLLASGNLALALLVAAAVLRSFFASVAMPAWNAFAGSFVPERLRGRYFSARNLGRQLAGLAIAPAAGFLIYRIGGITGWQVAWLVAFLFGVVSTAFYGGIPEEAYEDTEDRRQPQRSRDGPSALRDRNFLYFVGATGFFHFSVMVAGPFFSVYLVKELGASTAWVGITAAAMPLAGIIVAPVVGKLNDRIGAKRLLVFSALTIPIAPLLWTMVTAPWQVVFVNLLAGALWPAYLLSTFNLVLSLAPPEKRPSYTGLQQGAVFFASALGPLAGAFLIETAGFHLVFVLSMVGRLIAGGMMWRFVQEESQVGALARAPVPRAQEAPSLG